MAFDDLSLSSGNSKDSPFDSFHSLRVAAARRGSVDDKYPARYRAETLAAWREAHAEIDAEQIDAFVTVMRIESDKKFLNAAFTELITAPQLGFAELEQLARSDAKLIEKHALLIRRTVLARRLIEGVDDEILDQVIESKDAALQSPLVRDPRLTRKQAERLASRGANPTIRSNAEAWVKDNKVWR